MKTRRIRIRTTVKPTSSHSVKVRTTISDGNKTKTITKTIR